MLVVLTSAKGSPGVSTATVALAAAWSAGWRAAILECDPSGGDLAAGYGLSAEPGLLTLASAARRDRRPGLLWEHTQELPGGLAVAPAPSSAEQATAAIDVLMSSPALRVLAQSPSDAVENAPQGFEPRRESLTPGGHVGRAVEEGIVLVDLGRLPPHLGHDVGVSRLLAAADVVLLVARNEQQGIVHATARLDALRSAAGGRAERVRLLLVGAATFSPAEVALTLNVSVAGALPADARAAALLMGRPARRAGNLARLPLVRAAAAIGNQLSIGYRREQFAEAADEGRDDGESAWADSSGRSGRRRSAGAPPLREEAR